MKRGLLLSLAAGWSRRPLGPVFATIAFALGLAIAILSLSFYQDAQSYFAGTAAKPHQNDYVVLSKTVNLFTASDPRKSAFGLAELQTLRSQKFVLGIEPVIANYFDAEAQVQLGAARYRSEVFFEGVSNEFLDIQEPAWQWTAPSDPQSELYAVPIAIPRSFLALYNLGFANARGLPQIPESALSAVSLELHLHGADGERTMSARIVALTDKLDTILVPRSFMDWANQTLSSVSAREAELNPRRIVLKVDDPRSSELENFLRSKNYESYDASAGIREASFILNAILGGLLGLALILLGLAALVFGLNLSLFISRARNDLATLVLLGFMPSRLSRLSTLTFVVPIGAVSAIVLAICALVRQNVASYLAERSIPVSSGFDAAMYLGAAALLLLLALLHYFSLDRELRKSLAS